MGVNEFHIITVGVSLIHNYQRSTEDEKLRKARLSDPIWEELLDKGEFVKELLHFLKKNPRGHSAEVNSFMGYREKMGHPKRCMVYLVGTKTPVNELTLQTLLRYFRDELHVELCNPKEISVGDIWTKEHASEVAVEEFQKGISNLLDSLLGVAQKKKEEGYEILFNPTGGMKPHVIACALAGFITASKVYYIHEEFEKQDVVILPPLLYLPRGAEINVLEEIKRAGHLSGREFEKFSTTYREELNRLEFYELINISEDEITGKRYRVELTRKGKFILSLFGR